MKYSVFEKTLYKTLFDKFSKEEYHVDFSRDTYAGDFEQLRSALHHLDQGGIVFLIADSEDELCAELTPDFCYKLKEI